MISLFVASFLCQTAPLVLADQDWTLSLTTVGVFGSPLGELKDPMLTGVISITSSKEKLPQQNEYCMKLALKREQSQLVSGFTGGLPDKKDGPEIKAGAYKDKDFAYLIGSYRISRPDYKIQPIPGKSDDYFMSSAVLDPFSMTLVIAERSLNNPELRKEYFVMEDGPRKFSVIFRPNLNANTEQVPGDVAFKFDLKLKDEDGEYPQFFQGAIRLNTKTRKVQYFTATCDPEHQPKPPDDADLGAANKSYAIRIDAKKPKS